MQEEEFDFDRQRLSQKLLREYLEQEDALPDEAHQSQKWSRVRQYLLAIVGCLLVGFFIFAWQTDKFALTPSQVDSLPLVRAEQTPIKIQPDDPGGIKIANMDKTVFHSIDDEEVTELPKVTRILPAPEAPINRAEIALIPLKKEEIVANEPAKPVTEETTQKPVETQPTANALINVKEEPTIEDVIGEALKDIKPEDVMPTPVPKRKALVIPGEKKVEQGARIQLGAFRTSAEADERWNTLKNQFPDLLGSKTHYSIKADLGSKGIFYRLQVGPINGASEGRTICNELIEKKQGCFFVR